jgi:hypothetical protein
MLSFTVMHDTVINMLDSNEKLPISEYVKNSTQSHDVADVHDIHSMFHFIALTPTVNMFLSPLEKGNTFSSYSLQYTLPYLQNNNKPPIV